MTFREDTRLSGRLLFPVVVCLLIGNGLMHLRGSAARAMGHNGYWSVVVALIFSLVFVMAIFSLQKRFPGQTMIDYAPLIIGKVPAFVLSFAFLAYIVAAGSIVARDLMTMISTYLLDRTPIMAVIFIALIGVSYLAYHGLESTARASSFFFVPAVFMLCFFLLSGLLRVDFRNARPVFFGPPMTYLEGGSRMMFLFSGLVRLPLFLGFVREPDSGRRVTLWALALVFALFFLKTLGMIGAFGARGIQRYTWPVMEFAHIIELPLTVIGNVALVFFVVWQVFYFSSAATGYWAVSLGFARLFPFLNYKRIVVLLAPVILLLTALPGDTVQLRYWVWQLQTNGLYFGLAYPLALWLVAWIRRSRSQPAKPY